MKFSKIGLQVFAATAMSILMVAGLSAQGGGGKGKGQGKGKSSANVGQIMKGIFYINSNVIFYAQGNDPDKVPSVKDSSVSPNALSSAYGKWEAIENSALAIADGTPLLLTPRFCANGTAAPVTNPEWQTFVANLRTEALKAYETAKARKLDDMVDVATNLTEACGACHDKWRDVANLKDRCK